MNWNLLINFCNKNHLKLELQCNGIIYDKNFHYNNQTDVLLADSSTSPAEQFGSDGKTLMYHIVNHSIKLFIKR